jgi:hypothetical protein
MSTVPEDITVAFYAGKRSARVPLCVNDAVVVVGTEYSGRGGTVISIESASDDPLYLVEFGDSGSEAVLPLSALRLMGEGKT